MLPSDTDPTIIEPFRMLETDLQRPAASQQTIYDGNGSAGSASLETGPDQAVIFRDDATASSASIVNNGGETLFEDRTTAASASLTANEDGFMRFSGTSTGADSRIVVNEGGRLDFEEDAKAGAAFITNNAAVRFADRATAGNAQFVVNEGGVLAFRDASDAGIAQITTNGLTGFFGTSTLAGATITNNESGTVYFADDASAGTTSFIGNNGTVVFAGRSTLGGGAITSNATGVVRFEDSATAGDGFISSSGAVIFTDASSAADAEIVGNLGGLFLFRDRSTAGRAIISGASDVRFANRASAGSALITVAPGATISFTDEAVGGAARLQLDAGSLLDVSAAIRTVGVGSLAGAGSVRLGANTLAFGDATPLVSFAGNFSDAGRGGGLIKRGSGTVNLAGQSSYSGATMVQAGTLEAGVEDVFAPQSAFTVASGATLALAGFDQTIGSLAGAGLVDVSAGSVLTAGGNGESTVFSGVISGSGGIVKAGSGVFALTGASTYTGGTSVDAGTLRVDGNIASSPVTVGSAGTLMGSGTVGATVVEGTLAGRANGGALAVAGDLTLGAGAATVLELSGAQSGRFDVAGTARLGGTLAVRPTGTVVPDLEYVFLTAGLVTGTYSGVDADFAFLDPLVSYGPDFAALSLERNDVTFAQVGATPNQRAAGAAIEALGTGNAVFDAVVPLTAGNARAAFDNLSGEGHASALAGAGAAQEAVGRAVLDRLGDGKETGVWGVVQAGRVNRSSDGNGAEAVYDPVAMVGGADLVSTDALLLGIFGHLGQTDFSSRERATEGQLQSAGGGVYGQWSADRWRIRGVAALSYGEFELERRIAVGALTGTARSDYTGWAASAAAEVAYELGAGEFAVEPYARLEFAHVATDGFEESGAGAADLSSDGSSYSRLDAQAGARLSRSYELDSGVTVRPSLGIGYIRNVSGETAASAHRFAGGDDFEVSAARTGRDSAAIDARINVAFSAKAEGSVFYRGLLSEMDYDQLVGASFRIAF